MRLIIGAVGRLKTGPEREMLDRYVSLAAPMAPGIGLTVEPVREFPESRLPFAGGRREAEAKRLLELAAPGAILVVLDETGRDLSSAELAAFIERKKAEGVPEMTFLLGGPDGHGDVVRQKAGLVLRMGRMTWPHRMARIMLAEQLYRAITILTGHPYHRA